MHGDADRVVAYSWGKTSYDLLLQLGLDHKPEFMTIEVSAARPDPVLVYSTVAVHRAVIACCTPLLHRMPCLTYCPYLSPLTHSLTRTWATALTRRR